MQDPSGAVFCLALVIVSSAVADCAAIVIVIGPAPRPIACTTGSRSAGTVRTGVCKARV